MSDLRSYRDQIKAIRKKMEDQVGDLKYKLEHVMRDDKEEARMAKLNSCIPHLKIAEDGLSEE